MTKITEILEYRTPNTGRENEGFFWSHSMPPNLCLFKSTESKGLNRSFELKKMRKSFQIHLLYKLGFLPFKIPATCENNKIMYNFKNIYDYINALRG